MIVYIGFAQPDEWLSWAGTYARHAQRFELASPKGTLCLRVPFYHFTPALMRKLDPTHVILSGFARSFQDYEIASFKPVCDWVNEAAKLPILALCGSHQLMGFYFNGAMKNAAKLYDEPMRKRRAGEPITNPDYHPDFIMERGFYELELNCEDSLFHACARPPVVYESHYCEIKTLPPDFRLLASTEECKIQAMRHKSRPLTGLEFHPEDYSERFPDGRTILENFLQGRV